MAGQLHTLELTIANGASVSGSAGTGLDISGLKPVYLIMPSAWTAADITFSIGPDDVNYGWLSKDDGTIIKIPTSAASRGYLLPSSWFVGANYLILISGDVSTLTFVAQAAERKLKLVCEVI